MRLHLSKEVIYQLNLKDDPRKVRRDTKLYLRAHHPIARSQARYMGIISDHEILQFTLGILWWHIQNFIQRILEPYPKYFMNRKISRYSKGNISKCDNVKKIGMESLH